MSRTDRLTLSALRTEAAGCTACPLYASATQTVFGQGPVPSPLMLVGEQPGDHEDRDGAPFVGPAGRLLQECLVAAGTSIEAVYVTNAVKHFKWTPRGKARIHKTPTAGEITACHPWLEQEVALVRPHVVVALGASAARSVTGRPTRIGDTRGQVLTREGQPDLVVTVHPSAVLRARDHDDRDQMRAAFIDDLRLACAAAA